MKFARLLFICVVSIPAHWTHLPANARLSSEVPAGDCCFHGELNAVPNNPGLKLKLGMALHLADKKREAISELEAVKLD